LAHALLAQPVILARIYYWYWLLAEPKRFKPEVHFSVHVHVHTQANWFWQQDFCSVVSHSRPNY